MIFVALQCCQCSTMQVKQQKKSGNKWTCVVCNQKQSVRKVYAQGFMAKDVRKFVQSFNMSRQLTEQNQLLKDEEEETLENEDQLRSNRKQKRTDWSEYIDPAEQDFKSCDMDEKLGDEFEPKIITEIPKAVFKKPKLKNYCAISDTAGGDEFEPKIITEIAKAVFKKPKLKIYCATSDTADGDKPFMPAFGKRNPQTKNTAQEFGRLIERIPERRDNAVEIRGQFPDKQEARELKPTYGTSKDDDKCASKWSCYITEDSDDLLPASGRDLKIQANQWSNNAFENELNDQRVEEDIHPDFL